jgi:hypothetical protein
MGGRQLKSFKTSFTSGELMPALRARVDLKHYYTGAERLRNVNILPQGGVTRRPGLRHVAETSFQLTRLALNSGNQIEAHTSETSATGTVTASGFFAGGYEPWRAVDGTFFVYIGSTWLVALGVSQWLQYQFNTAKTITSYTLSSTDGNANRAPAAWTLYGSNTGAFAGEETTLDTRSGVTSWTAAGETKSYAIGTPASFTYYRLVVTATAGGDAYLAISEWQLLIGTGGTTTAPQGGTAANGVDNDPATLITTTNNLSTTTPYVVAHVDLGAATAIRFADVRNLYLSGGTVDFIDQEFRIQYSTDNTNWSDFGAVFARVAKLTIAPAVYQRRAAASGAAVSARYWRVARIGATDGDTNKVNLGDIQLFTEGATLSKARIIDFEYDDDNRFVMVATDGNIAVYQNDARIADVQIPHASADLAQLRWAQSLNTLLLFHRQYAPYKVLRIGVPGANNDWNGALQPFTGIPTYTFDSGGSAEAIMSTTRGWPACGTFFEGRLYLAGFAQAPASLCGSKAGDFFNLTVGSSDDDGFLITLDTDAANAIVNLYPGRNLSVFTTNAEFYLLPDADPITPASVVAKRSTEVGSLGPGVPVVAVEGAIMYLQKGGVALREFIYTYTETAYQSNNISLLAAHLFNTPVDMALRRSQAIDEGDMVALVNTDGTLMVLQTLRSQNLTGFSLHKTDGQFQAIGYETEFYFIVRRTINGTVKQFLEVWDDEHLMDCSTRSTTGLPTSTVTGMARFNGATIATRANEKNLSNEAVSGGSLTLDEAATTSYEVGLAFPDVSDDASGWQVYIKDEPVEIPGLPDGTMRFNKKRIYRPGLSLLDTQYASIRANGGAIQTVPLSTATPPTAVSGDYAEKMVMLGFSETAQVEIGQTVTGPFTCLALFKEVSG